MRTMINKFEAHCGVCDVVVPAGEGEIRRYGRRWIGRCKDHSFATYKFSKQSGDVPGLSDGAEDGGQPTGAQLRQDRRDYRERGISTIRTSGGTFYRNANGRCEDAPCCGCCTI